ncbi:hypothetical protein COCOBI_09-3960 [Coccomyxa sp. Obi]|nr:hypothetical protein COCOBI_09-3960 [Coccomyxa sp. Obi]
MGSCGDQEEEVTWEKVEQALAAGAALEEFLPAESRPHPHKRLKPTSGDAGADIPTNPKRLDAQAQQQHCSIVPEQETSITQSQVAKTEGQLQRWLAISQLRRALSSTKSDWDTTMIRSPVVTQLATADWYWVFAPPYGTVLADSMLLHPRAAVPHLASKWLQLLQIVGSRACATFVLCRALPCHCRSFGCSEASVTQSQDARQVVKHCFEILELSSLKVLEMLVLLKSLKLEGPLGMLMEAELRLRYFGATAKFLPAY